MTAAEARSLAHDLMFARDLPDQVRLWLEGVRRLSDNPAIDERAAIHLQALHRRYRGAVAVSKAQPDTEYLAQP